MRALRRSPLFCTALLSLAVLFAHTGRATNIRAIVPVAPPCAEKVAAAQPDPEKKLSPVIKRIVARGQLAHWHNLFGSTFGLPNAPAASLVALPSGTHIAVARWTIYVAPQRRPFALRI